MREVSSVTGLARPEVKNSVKSTNEVKRYVYECKKAISPLEVAFVACYRKSRMAIHGSASMERRPFYWHTRV